MGDLAKGMQADVEKVLLSEEDIHDIVTRLGEQIARDYEGKELLMVGVLNGGAIFLTDLARAVGLPLRLDFMRVSSYGSSTKSSGTVRILHDLSIDVSGHNVLLVDDIFDTGLTLSKLRQLLLDRGAQSVRVATFLVKDGIERGSVQGPEYAGAHVPNYFVVGYGLDYDEKYRNLPYVGVLKPEVYS